jgi:hypothetical protein
VKHKNFGSSVFVTGGIFLFLFVLLWGKEGVLLIILFVVVEIFVVLTTWLLILLRLFRVFKNRGSWIYYLTGTIQIFLAMTDAALLVLNKDMTRMSLFIFLGLNALLGICIFIDIYGKPESERNRR